MVAEVVSEMPSVLIARKWIPEELDSLVRNYNPKTDLGRLIKDSLKFLPLEQAQDLFDTLQRTIVAESSLKVRVFRNPNSLFIARTGLLIEDYGIVSKKVVTTAGVNFLTDAFQGAVEPEILNFHGIGTGAGAEAVGDTALTTELTTEYNPDNTRDTGTQGEGASANIYQSVGLNTLDSGTPAIIEHGLFSQAATGGGTLWDRSTFGAINLDGTQGDGLESTYELTASSGG